MRSIFRIQPPKLHVLIGSGLLTAAALALAGCASSNLAHTYDTNAPEAVAPQARARTADAPSPPPTRRAITRRDDSVAYEPAYDADPTDVSATGATHSSTTRRISAGHSAVTKSSTTKSSTTKSTSAAPAPLSDEWNRIEDAKEERLRRTMNSICRGC